VRLHHIDEINTGNAHFHPHFSIGGAASASFPAPAPEDLRAGKFSYLEIILKATDASGLSATTSLNLQPKRVDVTVASAPSGLALGVNGEPVTAPRTIVMWPNWEVALEANKQFDGQGRFWQFSRWSDGGAAAHTILAPATARTYTATFAEAAVRRVFLPSVRSR
jgi:hypothetical protein